MGEEADDWVVFAGRNPSPSETARRAFGSAAIRHNECELPACKMDTFLVRPIALQVCRPEKGVCIQHRPLR